MELIYITITLAVFSFVCLCLIFYNFKVFIWGIKDAFFRSKHKTNYGYIAQLDKNNNIGLNNIIGINKEKMVEELSTKNFPLPREAFTKLTLFGTPTLICPTDDCMSTVGIHYNKLDKEGKPIKDKEGNPVITEIKPSTTIDPETFKLICIQLGLSKEMAELLKKITLGVLIIGGVFIVALIGAFFAYKNNEILSNLIPLAQTALQACQNNGVVTAVTGVVTK